MKRQEIYLPTRIGPFQYAPFHARTSHARAPPRATTGSGTILGIFFGLAFGASCSPEHKPRDAYGFGLLRVQVGESTMKAEGKWFSRLSDGQRETYPGQWGHNYLRGVIKPWPVTQACFGESAAVKL